MGNLNPYPHVAQPDLQPKIQVTQPGLQPKIQVAQPGLQPKIGVLPNQYGILRQLNQLGVYVQGQQNHAQQNHPQVHQFHGQLLSNQPQIHPSQLGIQIVGPPSPQRIQGQSRYQGQVNPYLGQSQYQGQVNPYLGQSQYQGQVNPYLGQSLINPRAIQGLINHPRIQGQGEIDLGFLDQGQGQGLHPVHQGKGQRPKYQSQSQPQVQIINADSKEHEEYEDDYDEVEEPTYATNANGDVVVVPSKKKNKKKSAAKIGGLTGLIDGHLGSLGHNLHGLGHDIHAISHDDHGFGHDLHGIGHDHHGFGHGIDIGHGGYGSHVSLLFNFCKSTLVSQKGNSAFNIAFGVTPKKSQVVYSFIHSCCLQNCFVRIFSSLIRINRSCFIQTQPSLPFLYIKKYLGLQELIELFIILYKVFTTSKALSGAHTFAMPMKLLISVLPLSSEYQTVPIHSCVHSYAVVSGL